MLNRSMQSSIWVNIESLRVSIMLKRNITELKNIWSPPGIEPSAQVFCHYFLNSVLFKKACDERERLYLMIKKAEKEIVKPNIVSIISHY